MRIKGSFEPIAFPVQREVKDDGVLISGGFKERYQLRGDRLCLEDAKNLASIISNEDFLILDKTWEIVGDVVKDNDEGGLWYPTINFERTICDSKDSCGFDF